MADKATEGGLMPKIKVLLADDHTILREGVRVLLEAQSDMEVVAEARDGQEAVDRTRQFAPDVVIMDIAMPGLNGLEATRRMRRESPLARVLVLTMHGTDDYFFQFLGAGASGYVLKEAAFSDLVAAVRAVYRGGTFLYPALAGRLVEDYFRRVAVGEEAATYESLTEREKGVLKLIGEGYTNQEIARRLYLSVNTVQTHRTHIMEKLNLHSRAALMRFAMRMGWLAEGS